jgi:excisionase family DNA binding protein
MVSLDQLAHDPARAALVSPAERSMLIVQCASIIMALTCTTSDTMTNRQSDQAAPTVRDERLLTIDQVAEILRFAPSYTYELVRRGEIRAMRHGRYWRVRPNEVDKFIANHERIST